MLELEIQRIRDRAKSKSPFILCTARAVAGLCRGIDLPKRLAVALAKDPEMEETETDILVAIDMTLKFAGSGRRQIHIALPAAEYMLDAAGKSAKPPAKP